MKSNTSVLWLTLLVVAVCIIPSFCKETVTLLIKNYNTAETIKFSCYKDINRNAIKWEFCQKQGIPFDDCAYYDLHTNNNGVKGSLFQGSLEDNTVLLLVLKNESLSEKYKHIHTPKL